VYTVDFIYAMMFYGLVFKSMLLTNRNDKFQRYIYGVSTVYGFFTLMVIGVLLFDIINGFLFL
jgi:hypothetical protein